MSSLSIHGLGQGLDRWFGSSSQAGPAAPTQGASGCSAAGATTPGAATSSTAQASPPKAGGHHRHHGSKQFQQIQDAVTNALQAAQSTGSTSDPNKVIEDAIAKVFKQQAGSTSSTSSTSPTTAAPQPSGSDTDGDTDASGVANADGTSSQQAFFKSLRSLGVSPTQFRSDFLAAIQDAQQTGKVDVNSALKSLPTGSVLDAIG